MSGHSKWSSIKHKKAAQDARRGKLFAKLLRAVEVAARQGGGEPAGNPALAQAIEKAKAASVPIDNIDRAIKRGTGEAEGAHYEEAWYEGYAPGGVALYVQVLTDNRNRAASDVRSAFTRGGGSLGEPGSVSYVFEPKGYLLVSGDEDEDEVMMAALEGGAEDVRATEDVWEVVSEPADLQGVRQRLAEAELEVVSAELVQLPRSTVPVEASVAPRVLRLIESLEDLDDVQSVYANFDIPEEVLAQVG
ncbi:MAG: YebC/PmpR family DNA-binding transcriptional regulator [Actinomycetota bacterium]|nr:YebC/PmpR family DNA-binding transcriptional regulator [Actinomycetota bacterium]